jgi:hypothetical protein
MEERRRRILSLVDPARETGIEIGPLARPIVDKAMGAVLYTDHLSTEDLREHYRADAEQGRIDLSGLVDVDLVVPTGERLSDRLGPSGPVDYVVASHVIEHIPDPVGWLGDIAACLRDGGHLCLAVPDKRFIFDHLREPTQVRELVEWSQTRPARPTPGQVYDHVQNLAEVDGWAVWQGNAEVRRHRDPGSGLALGMAREAATGRFHDVHCTVFTPWSFALVWTEIMAQGLLPFEFASLDPTRFGDVEFFATFRKHADGSAAERVARAPILDPRAHHELPGPPAPSAPPAPAAPTGVAAWAARLRRLRAG